MTSAQIEQYKKLIADKGLFIELCTKEDSQLGSKVSSLYRQIELLFPQYYSDLLNSGLAAANAVNAYKTHKIDPYVAGGIGQSIGGIGVGVVGAATAAQRNKRIDEWRQDSTQKSDQAKYQLNSSEGKLIALFEELIELLNSSKNVQDYRKEQTYLAGKQFLSSNKHLEALSCFEKTREYKETEKHIEEIREWWNKTRTIDIIKICVSILIAAITVIICVNSYNNSLIMHTAVNNFRSNMGLLILFLGALPIAVLGAAFSNSKWGALLGLSTALGGILMGIGSNEAKDAPTGSISYVGSGLFLIAISVAIVSLLYLYNCVGKMKDINARLNGKKTNKKV